VESDIGALYMVSRHAYPHAEIELLTYRAALRAGEIRLHSHQAYRWVTLAELTAFDFCAADLPIVRKLRADAAISA